MLEMLAMQKRRLMSFHMANDTQDGSKLEGVKCAAHGLCDNTNAWL